MIQWTQDLSVEVPEMDHQHQRWIQLINRLEEAMVGGSGNEVVDGVSDELQAFARQHFTDEEALLAQRGYPDLEAHRDLHRAFFAQLDQINQTTSLKSFKTSQVLKLMQGWLIQHVTQEDQRYGSFLKG